MCRLDIGYGVSECATVTITSCGMRDFAGRSREIRWLWLYAAAALAALHGHACNARDIGKRHRTAGQAVVHGAALVL